MPVFLKCICLFSTCKESLFVKPSNHRMRPDAYYRGSLHSFQKVSHIDYVFAAYGVGSGLHLTSWIIEMYEEGLPSF